MTGRSLPLRGTSGRIAASLAALVLVFCASSFVAFRGLEEISSGVRELRVHEQVVRTALELGSAVRDLYAHQAHTIILGNETHLGFYTQAHARVAKLAAAIGEQPGSPRQRELILRFQGSVQELDQLFRQRIVPAVVRGDAAVVQREHAQAQELVAGLQSTADELAQAALASIGAFEERAMVVQHATVRWTLAFLIGATLTAAVIGSFLGRSVIGPLKTLGAGAARVAQGDLDTRIELDSSDEFGALANQLNAMTASLKEHQEKLVQQEKLAGIGRLAAGVAHELNNPLGVILGYTKLLKNRAQGEQAEDLGIIEEEALRCQHIVESLLDLARPRAFVDQRVELRKLCDDVVQRLREAGPLAGVEVLVSGDGQVNGSPERLHQVASNLVRNAAEAAGKGGHVRVAITAGPGAVQLAVSDDGPGIPADARSRLFEPFFTTKASGTGLGLAVSQAIAHAHGGRIEAANGASGGAVFTLWLADGPEARA